MVNKGLEWVCIVLFMVMTLVGTYQILTRYIFNRPSTVSEELLTFMFTWLALLAAAYVFGKKEHMRLAYFAGKVKPKNKVYLEIFSEGLIAIFALSVMVFGGVSITRLGLAQETASLGIPRGYIYMVVPLAGALTLFYNIVNIKTILDQRKQSKEELTDDFAS